MEAIKNDEDLDIIITRAKFEQIIEEHLKKLIPFVEDCLKTSEISKD